MLFRPDGRRYRCQQVMYDGMDVVVGGGLESISLAQTEHMNLHRFVDDELMAMHPNIHMPMLQTAETVAQRYDISRDAMDEYGLQSPAAHCCRL